MPWDQRGAYLGTPTPRWDPPVVRGNEALMREKEHGSSSKPVQQDLRWSCDVDLADKICNFNRHGAEHRGYFQKTSFIREANNSDKLLFFDSNTGKLLFRISTGRSFRS